MSKEMSSRELLNATMEMRERQVQKHGEDSEQVELIDQVITGLVTED